MMQLRQFRWLALLALGTPVVGAAQAPTPRLVAAAGVSADDPARETAIAKLSAFLAKYPDSPMRPNALVQLGELLVRRADEAFASAQRSGGATEGGRAAGGAARADLPDRPDYSAAIGRYEEVLQRYPSFAQLDAAAYTLATLYSTEQRYADAARTFELVTKNEKSPFRAEAYFRLGDAEFELASKERGDARRARFAKAAQAYERATEIASPQGDIYFLSLYKLGWSFYNQATQVNQPEYQRAVDVFGRLVTEYDRLTPERQARLGLRAEAIEYMAVALTQLGGAEAAKRYFDSHGGASLRLPVLRRVAVSLRDQGDFVKAVNAFKAVQAEAPTDSTALGVQREIIDIYQNRVLEPDSAQRARLELVTNFAPGTPWAQANPALLDRANAVREEALRQSAQHALASAQTKRDKARFAEAAELYERYMREFAMSDSAQAVDFLYGEALFGQGEYLRAGAEYSRAAYALKGERKLAAQAGQNAIVAFDSAAGRNRDDAAALDSLFAAVDRFVTAFPESDVARKALIQKGKRASESRRWDVMAATFRTYAERYPNDPYTPTAEKLIGDAYYQQGRYAEAQGQWERAQNTALTAGRRKLADSITTIRNAAAVSFGDSLVKAGDYRRAAEDVYVAFADRNPTSEKAPDALRNAIETYVLADSAARARGDDSASQQARQRAAELSRRVVDSYPKYKFRAQYQELLAELLAGLGHREESIEVLGALIRENPRWTGRADAMVRLAVVLDSAERVRDAAVAYEQFAAAYPKDERAADAQYNAAVTYLQAADTAAAVRAYATFASRFPREPRVGAAQQARVALLRAAGNAATAEAELDRLCARPSEALRATCDERLGESEFRKGQALFARYQPIKLVIPSRADLTRAGVERLSAKKRSLLKAMSAHFSRAIAAGAPEWLSASSYYIGLAQWEYGNYLKGVELPADLTGEQLSAAQAGSAQQAEQYYQAARQTWQALVDKAEQQKFTNNWVERARAAAQGTVDAAPPADPRVPQDEGRAGGAS